MKKTALEKKIKELRHKLNVIEEREAGELSARLYRKCFKVRNCYSCPKAPSDYWYLYLKVIHVEGSRVTTTSFQTDQYGKCDFEPKQERHNGLVSSYQEISEKEFVREFEKFKRKIVCP